MFGCRIERFGTGIQFARGLSHNENLIKWPLAMLYTKEKTWFNMLSVSIICFFGENVYTKTLFLFCLNDNAPLIKDIICKFFCYYFYSKCFQSPF